MNMEIPQSPIRCATASYIYGRLASNPKAFDEMESVDIIRALFGVAATEPSPVDLTEAMIRTIEPDREFEIRNIIRDKSICGAIWRFTSTHKFMVELQKIPGMDGKMMLGMSLVVVNPITDDGVESYTARTLVRYNGTKITFCDRSVQSTLVNTDIRDMLIKMHDEEISRLEAAAGIPQKESNESVQTTQSQGETGSTGVPDRSSEDDSSSGEDSAPDSQEENGEGAGAAQEGIDAGEGREEGVPDAGVAEGSDGEAEGLTSQSPATAAPAPEVPKEEVAQPEPEWSFECSLLGSMTFSTEQLEACSHMLKNAFETYGDNLNDALVSAELIKITGANIAIETLAIDRNEHSVTCVAHASEVKKPEYTGMIEVFAQNFKAPQDKLDEIQKKIREHLATSPIDEAGIKGLVYYTLGPDDYAVTYRHIDDQLFGKRDIIRIYIVKDINVDVIFPSLGDQAVPFAMTLKDEMKLLSDDELNNLDVQRKCVSTCLERALGADKAATLEWTHVFDPDDQRFLVQETTKQEYDLSSLCGPVKYLGTFETDEEFKAWRAEATEMNNHFGFVYHQKDADKYFGMLEDMSFVDITDSITPEMAAEFAREEESWKVEVAQPGEATTETINNENKEEGLMEENIQEAQDTRIDLTDDRVRESLLVGILGVSIPAITHLTKFLKQHLTKIEDKAFAATNGTIPTQVTIVYEDLTYCFVKMMDGEFYRMWVAHTNLGLTDHGWIETRDEDGRWFRLGRDVQNQTSGRGNNNRHGRRY